MDEPIFGMPIRNRTGSLPVAGWHRFVTLPETYKRTQQECNQGQIINRHVVVLHIVDQDSCKSAKNSGGEWMTRPTNNPVTERARQLAERLRKHEAYHQAAEEIRADHSFSRVIRRVAAESLRLQQNQHPDEGSNLSSLGETKSIMQALAVGEDDLEPFSAIELDSDGDHSAHLNYRSNPNTSDGLADEESDNLPTLELEITELESSEKMTIADQQ